jgi:hypothetical protein
MNKYFKRITYYSIPLQFKTINKFLKEIPEKPLLTTGLVLAVLSILIFTLSFPFYTNDMELFYENILIEAHGMLFDLLIIGLLLVWLNKNGERQLRIRRYAEEIDDYRHWKTEEASYKIIGNIKRLNKDKITQIDLFNTYLKNSNLNYVDLTGSNMNYVVLDDASLIHSMLRKVRLNQASLINAKLNKADLSGAFLSGANCEGASMIKTNFENAQLIKVSLKGAFLMDANFSNAMLAGSDFTDANLLKADLRGALGVTVEQLSTAHSLVKTLLEPSIEAELRLNYPQLFESEETDKTRVKLA